MIVFSFVELSFGLLSIRQLDELFAVHLNVRPAQIDLISIRAPLLLKFVARGVGARRIILGHRFVAGHLARAGSDQKRAPF